jgi:hypothetical protein
MNEENKKWEIDILWGSEWLGMYRLRVWVNEKDHKTYWFLTIWEFTFGFSPPAFLVKE